MNNASEPNNVRSVIQKKNFDEKKWDTITDPNVHLTLREALIEYNRLNPSGMSAVYRVVSWEPNQE